MTAAATTLRQEDYRGQKVKMQDDIVHYLAGLDGVLEEIVQKQVSQVGVLVEGLLDVAKETTEKRGGSLKTKNQSSPANDAPSPPHQGNGAVVELPAVVDSSLSEEHEPLGIRHYLGCIQSLGTGRSCDLR